MKKLMILVLAAAIFIAANSFAGQGKRAIGRCEGMGFHQQMGHHFNGMGDNDFRRNGPGRLLMMADEIGLDDTQIEKLETMMTDFQMQMIDRKAFVKKAVINLRVLKRDDNADNKKVMAAIDEMSRLKADIHKMCYNHHRQVRDLLTAEQLEKLDKLCFQRRGMRMGNRQPGYGDGSGPRRRFFLDDDDD
ncbi:MAG: Spy/CpxP family protein refolding chaperone [candidate division Zixibacteria bacterium]|nr:Spy/CpxP family protein refolding chaperone [candidate division Zixibacteria bacterium]